jgi:tetratricopeptide (TPR) repeat protein
VAVTVTASVPCNSQGIPRSAGPAAVSLIGPDTRVILKARDVTVKADDRVVATGEVHRIYRVEKVDGGSLAVAADGVRGRVKVEDVIPLEQAVTYFTEQIRRRPRAAWAYKMRGQVRYDLGDFDQAIADQDEAIRVNPKDPEAYTNRALAWSAKHDYDRAIADDNEATRLDPKDAVAYHDRGNAWFAKRDYDLAVSDYNEAIRLDSKDPEKLRSRALAWSALGEDARALGDYDAIVKLDAKNSAAHLGRAWIRATSPDLKLRNGRLAVDSATRACELTAWKDPYCLGALAAANAEKGDFAAAVDWQSKALALFPKDDDSLAGHRRRLALYQMGSPYHEAPRPR